MTPTIYTFRVSTPYIEPRGDPTDAKVRPSLWTFSLFSKVSPDLSPRVKKGAISRT